MPVEDAPFAHDVPIIGPGGRLTYGGRTVCLSERNALLVGVLIYHFGSELTDLELLYRVWPDGATRGRYGCICADSNGDLWSAAQRTAVRRGAVGAWASEPDGES